VIPASPLSIRATRTGILRWAIPGGLGAIQAAVAYALVFFALAAPPKQPGFRGIDNDTTSAGSLRRLDLYRQAVEWIPGLSPAARPHLTPTAYLWGLRAALIVLALLQLVALIAVLRSATAQTVPWWVWLVGPAATALVLLAYPPLSSDVFYYAISGHVANAGFNPYLVVPGDFPSDPFLRFNDWWTIPSPYGPLWTSASRGVIAITGASPVRAVVAFKITAALAALALGAVAYAVARRMTDDPARALGALVLVAWAPALLIESAGTAHNDAVMLLCALAGLWLLTRDRLGAIRGGLLLIAASALIKYITLPLLGFAFLWRLRDREARWSTLLDRWLADLAAVAALSVAVFAPYWAGKRTITSLITEPIRLFVNPLWLLPQIAVVARWGEHAGDVVREQTRAPAAWTAVGIVVLAGLWLLVRSVLLRRKTAGGCTVPTQPMVRLQAVAWGVAAAAIALLPVNAHAWYAIWAIGPVALAWASTGFGDDGKAAPPRIRWWLVLYLVWLATDFIVYHTRAPN